MTSGWTSFTILLIPFQTQLSRFLTCSITCRTSFIAYKAMLNYWGIRSEIFEFFYPLHVLLLSTSKSSLAQKWIHSTIFEKLIITYFQNVLIPVFTITSRIAPQSETASERICDKHINHTHLLHPSQCLGQIDFASLLVRHMQGCPTFYKPSRNLWIKTVRTWR